jgi:hypothetical protein
MIPRKYSMPAMMVAFLSAIILSLLYPCQCRFVLYSDPLLRFSHSSVRECRGRAAPDNGRGFVDKRVILKSLDHELGVVHAARDVACENGIAYVARE